jgi:hypothetical protein
MSGHPDDQSYAVWRDTPAINETTAFVAGDTAYPIKTTSHFASLHLHCHLNSGQASIKLVHVGTGPTELKSLSYQWKITTLTGLVAIVPLLSTQWRLHVVVPAAQNANVDITATPTNVGVQDIAYPVVGNNIIVGTTSIPASGTDKNDLTHIQGGQAFVEVIPFDTSAKLKFFVVEQNDDGSTGSTVWENDGPTAIHTDFLMLPDTPCSLFVSNTDGAAAHSYKASLVPGGPT